MALLVKGPGPIVQVPPCILFEDDHLLVVNKPAGLNTHAPSPHAGEGIYDWLRHREPRWAELAIIHRLDKETSGVLVFSKTAQANKSLHDQFASRQVHKTYWLASRGGLPEPRLIKSSLVRAGERYVSRPWRPGPESAETRFRPMARPPLAEASPGLCWMEAEPLTGRTHQIRVHAADAGFPIIGDGLYGGEPAERLYLHAARISFRHPATDRTAEFSAPMEPQNALALRKAFIPPESTTAFRLIHGASDRWPGLYVQKMGHWLLAESETELSGSALEFLREYAEMNGIAGVYYKNLRRSVRGTKITEASPGLAFGRAAPDRFDIRENGLKYELSFSEGYSVGLFLDQRDNRRRLASRHIAAGFSLPPGPLRLLNTFSYTCGFSVAAASGGLETTSLDLSRKYLEWGKRNLRLNEHDPGEHDFIYGDVFDWLRRLARKDRQFECVVLDPPSFSQSKESGTFRAEKDYPKLVESALRLLSRGGVLLASTNLATWPAEDFVQAVRAAIRKNGRVAQQEHYAPQPIDFPVSRAEPAYLKTLWVRVQ